MSLPWYKMMYNPVPSLLSENFLPSRTCRRQLVVAESVSDHQHGRILVARVVLPGNPLNRDTMMRVVLVALMAAAADAFLGVKPSRMPTNLAATIDTSFMWNRGLNFGKGDFKFYSGFDSWMKVFPEEDRNAYPEVFSLPKGLYEVELGKPMGIVFEEIDIGRGLYVKELAEGGKAAAEGTVKVGDVLVGITAVKVVGAKYERRMIPCRGFDFDTMVGAVQSNDTRYGCNSVLLMLQRPEEGDDKVVDEFLTFFEPPFDNPWKQQQ